MINDTKNTASIDNEELSSKDITWDEADFTWDEAAGSWDNPFGIANDDKNVAAITNESKS